MTRALLAACAGVVALVTTRVLLRSIVPDAPLRRPNYRGLPVASGLGLVALIGIACGTAVTALLFSIDTTSPLLGVTVGRSVPLLALVFGFGLVGLFDDLSESPERGFRGHLTAARRGRATSGGLKLLAGGAVALAVAAPESTSFGWTLAHGAIIALCANVFNGLDVRPGRAGKFFFLAAAPLAVFVSKLPSAAFAASIGAVAGFLPDDLHERAMLGDAGSNALGALVGGGIVYAEPSAWVRLAVLGGLIVMTALAERPGFSRIIAVVPPLNALDRAGRVPEVSAGH